MKTFIFRSRIVSHSWGRKFGHFKFGHIFFGQTDRQTDRPTDRQSDILVHIEEKSVAVFS